MITPTKATWRYWISAHQNTPLAGRYYEFRSLKVYWAYYCYKLPVIKIKELPRSKTKRLVAILIGPSGKRNEVWN